MELRGRLDSRTIRRAQVAMTLGFLTAVALSYWMAPQFRAEVGRATTILATGDPDALGAYLRSFGVWGPLASIGLMVAQALVAPFPHFLVVFANGLAFGLWSGWALSLAGQTLAAAVCFGLARALGRGPVEALVGRFGLETADRWFARWGTAGVLATRLVPGIGFDAVSYAAGLTGVGFGTFLAATVAGSAPQALLYAYLGQQAPQAAWLLLAVTGIVAALVGIATLLRRRATSCSVAWHTARG